MRRPVDIERLRHAADHGGWTPAEAHAVLDELQTLRDRLHSMIEGT